MTNGVGSQQNGETETFEAEYGESQPSMAILEAIASIEGVPTSEVDILLYESIDPEALDTLIEGRDTDIRPEFSVDNYEVTVRNETLRVEIPVSRD